MDEKFILSLAKRAVGEFIRNKKQILIPDNYPDELNGKRGIFVTIYKKNDLRGCIGIPYPIKPLVEGIVEASVSACQDSRFSPLRENDIKDLRLEISILTEPRLIEVKDQKEYLKKIKIGRDGLIIKRGLHSGLLLPQVPVEQRWDVETYLEGLCYKAGLSPDSWKDEKTKIYSFQTKIIRELFTPLK